MMGASAPVNPMLQPQQQPQQGRAPPPEIPGARAAAERALAARMAEMHQRYRGGQQQSAQPGMPQQGGGSAPLQQPAIAAGSGMAALRASTSRPGTAGGSTGGGSVSNMSLGGSGMMGSPAAASGMGAAAPMMMRQQADEGKYHLDRNASGGASSNAWANGPAGRLAAENAVLRDELRRLPEELMRSTRSDLQRLEGRVNALVKENKGLSEQVDDARQSQAQTEADAAGEVERAAKEAREAALAEAQEQHAISLREAVEQEKALSKRQLAKAEQKREYELEQAAKAAEADKAKALKLAEQRANGAAVDAKAAADADAALRAEAARAAGAEETRQRMSDERDEAVRAAREAASAEYDAAARAHEEAMSSLRESSAAELSAAVAAGAADKEAAIQQIMDNPPTVEVIKEVEKEVEVIVEKVIIKEVPVIKEVIKEVAARPGSKLGGIASKALKKARDDKEAAGGEEHRTALAEKNAKIEALQAQLSQAQRAATNGAKKAGAQTTAVTPASEAAVSAAPAVALPPQLAPPPAFEPPSYTTASPPAELASSPLPQEEDLAGLDETVPEPPPVVLEPPPVVPEPPAVMSEAPVVLEPPEADIPPRTAMAMPPAAASVPPPRPKTAAAKADAAERAAAIAAREAAANGGGVRQPMYSKQRPGTAPPVREHRPAPSYDPPAPLPRVARASATPPVRNKRLEKNLLPPFTKIRQPAEFAPPPPPPADVTDGGDGYGFDGYDGYGDDASDTVFVTQNDGGDPAAHDVDSALPAYAGGPPDYMATMPSAPMAEETTPRPYDDEDMYAPLPPAAPPAAAPLDEDSVRLGASLLRALHADALSHRRAAVAAGGEFSPRVSPAQIDPSERMPAAHRGVCAAFVAALEVFLAENEIAGETTLAELTHGGGPGSSHAEDQLPAWAVGSNAGRGADVAPPNGPSIVLDAITAHTGLSLVESLMAVARRENCEAHAASTLFAPSRSLFVCADDYVCVSDMIDAVRFGLHKASVAASAVGDAHRGAWVDAFCASPADGAFSPAAAVASRDAVIANCDDVILFASPLLGEWQRPNDQLLRPRSSAPPAAAGMDAGAAAGADAAAHAAEDADAPAMATGPAALTRASCVLACANALAQGKALHVELAGHDREDLPRHLEGKLLELDDCLCSARAEGLQVDDPAERGMVEERLVDAAGGAEGAVELVQRSLRSWLTAEAAVVMKDLEAVRGPGLPLPMRDQLAKVLTSAGRPGEAEALLVLEASLREQALGGRHVETLSAVTSLARLLASQGQTDEASNLYRHALSEYTASLGPDSPLTLRTQVTLAELLAESGGTDEAASLYRAALSGMEKAFGPAHPQTLQTTDHLGMVLAEQGKRALAASVFKRALDGYMQAYGPKHPETLGTQSNLANALRLSGKLDQAAGYYQQAVKGLVAALGPSDRETLRAMHGLASVLAAQRKHADAVPLYQQAYDGRAICLGELHPSTLHTLGELGQSVVALGRIQAAVALHRTCLDGCMSVHGPTHEATLLATERLANALNKQGVLTEAEEQYRLCVAGYEAAHGKGGASTRKVGTKLVDNLIAQAKLLEAQDVAKYYRLEWSMRQPKKPVAGSMAGELLGGSVSAIKGFSVDKPGVRR